MWYFLCLSGGMVLGVILASLFGAGKIRHLEEVNDQLWKMYQKHRAELLLKIMGENGDVGKLPVFMCDSAGKEDD